MGGRGKVQPTTIYSPVPKESSPSSTQNTFIVSQLPQKSQPTVATIQNSKSHLNSISSKVPNLQNIPTSSKTDMGILWGGFILEQNIPSSSKSSIWSSAFHIVDAQETLATIRLISFIALRGGSHSICPTLPSQGEEKVLIDDDDVNSSSRRSYSTSNSY